eukprot:6184305-Pleurochrysis_carterae.AAC.2
MDKLSITGWSIRSKTLCLHDHIVADLVQQMDSVLGRTDLATKLCAHLYGPRGIVYVNELKELYFSTVQEEMWKAGLNTAFADALARQLFPKGLTFPERAFGAGKVAAEKKDHQGGNEDNARGYHPLKITSPHLRSDTATKQVGGVANMAKKFQFSRSMNGL